MCWRKINIWKTYIIHVNYKRLPNARNQVKNYILVQCQRMKCFIIFEGVVILLCIEFRPFGLFHFFRDSISYTTQKKFRITYYILFVHTILNSHSYAWRERNCMKLSRLHQWACESTSTNFQDDLTASLENQKNRIFPKILR